MSDKPEWQRRQERRAAYRKVAWLLTAVAILLASVGIWAWDRQWGLQAAVVGVVAALFAAAGAES